MSAAASARRLEISRAAPIRREIARPDQLDLDTPGRRDYWVALEHDSIWGDHLIPLTVFVGREARPGRGLLATGSNHGNEYEGPIALKHLLREIDPEAVTGRIIVVPVINVAAFASGTRESVAEDGVNLNRAFVEAAGKNPALSGITHRIAAFVRKLIWPRVHVVIDLHSGGAVARFAPLMTYHASDDAEQSRAILETARWFGTPLLSELQSATVGLLFSEAHRLGKIAISSELGWGCGVLPEGVRMARHGVLAAAMMHGQLRGEPEAILHHRAGTQLRIAMSERACFSPAPFAGHFEPLRECGDRVAAGETLALLHDFARIDEEPQAIVAAHDGILAAHAWGAPVRQGQHVAVVAKVLGPA
jgi:N-alpha-acetyl-L-2,4-diaminobutyrate deacetylase